MAMRRLLRLRQQSAHLGRGAARLCSSSPGAPSGGFSFPAPRSLQQIVKLELLAREPPAQIRRIWEDFHSTKDDAVATAMTSDALATLETRAKAAPMLVLPVYRQGGYFTIVSQFQKTCFLLTSLAAYNENPASAPPCLTVSLFRDLVDSKQLGLIRADVVNMLDKAESLLLLHQLLACYTQDALFHWVDTFNHRPDAFDFEAYRQTLLATH